MKQRTGIVCVTLILLSIMMLGYLVGGVFEQDNQRRPVINIQYEHGIITGEIVSYRNVGIEPSLSYFGVCILLIGLTMVLLIFSSPKETR